MSESAKSVASEPANRTSGSEEELPRLDEKLTRILEERNLGAECPRCGSNEWLVDRLALPVLSLPVTDFQAPRPDVPMLFFTCRNCGWIAMHSLKILGIEP
jgi:predicted nucleic-acid-binding Zn-ribbon protein